MGSSRSRGAVKLSQFSRPHPSQLEQEHRGGGNPYSPFCREAPSTGVWMAGPGHPGFLILPGLLWANSSTSQMWNGSSNIADLVGLLGGLIEIILVKSLTWYLDHSTYVMKTSICQLPSPGVAATKSPVLFLPFLLPLLLLLLSPLSLSLTHILSL